MVMAHLRGLLPKEHKYGPQSLTTEVVILESIMSEESAVSLGRLSDTQSAYFSSLAEESKNKVMQHNRARLTRIAELRSLDIYRGEKQLLARLTAAKKTRGGDVSLYKLFQLSKDHGIFEDLIESTKDIEWTPLL